MHFVDHDERQIGEHTGPSGVMGKHTRMEHVGVGDQYPAALSGGAPGVGRRIAVVRDRPMVEPRVFQDSPQALFLVAGQRLGRE